MSGLGLARTIAQKVDDPKFWRRVHGTLALTWLVLLPPTLIWWKNSIPWLNFMSVFACCYAAVSAWQGSRAEQESGET